MTNQPYEIDDDTVLVQKKSSSGGCLKGCLIIALILFLIVVGLVVGGYYYLKSQVNKYTSDTPADIPSVTLPAEQLEELQARIDTFQSSFEEGAKPAEEQPKNIELILTQDEINALIASNPDFANRVFITVNQGVVGAELSIPMDAIPGGDGRYLNATASLNVSMENGVLLVTIADASIKGEPIPQEYIAALQSENLAGELYKDPKAVEVIQRVKELKVEDKKFILIARPKASSDQSSDDPTQELAGDETKEDAEASEESMVMAE